MMRGFIQQFSSVISLIFLSLVLGACLSEPFVPMNVREATATSAPSATGLVVETVEITPISTSSPEPIDQSVAASETPLAANTPQSDCVEVAFLSDVSIPDGTRMEKNEVFLKIWRLENAGTCPWPADMMLVFSAGDALGATQSLPLRPYPEGVPLLASLGERSWADLRLTEVLPGQQVDIPLMFQAPASAGRYFSVWSLRSPEMDQEYAKIYVQIEVNQEETPAPSSWGGAWIQQNQHTGGAALPLFLQERDLAIQGYFYTQQGELFLLEGGLFDQGRRVVGTFGPPYHDGFPFEWKLTDNPAAYQGVFQDRLISNGAWCGARDLESLPVPCRINP